MQFLAYRVGDIVAELRIPVGGISLLKTSYVSGKLARRLRRDLPFAQRFKLIKWYMYSPIEAQPSTDLRVSYCMLAAALVCLSPGLWHVNITDMIQFYSTDVV